MANNDTLEFYDGDTAIAHALSSMVPQTGDMISIRKKVWKVRKVTFALDYADERGGARMRANVDLVKPNS